MKKRVTDVIERSFRPEFINRLDDTVVFKHLTPNDLKSVIDLELLKVRERLGERGLKLELTDNAKEFIIKKGSNTDFGARPLRRAVENYIEDPLAEELLKGEFQGKDKIIVDGIVEETTDEATGKTKKRVVRLDFKGMVEAQQPVAAT
jgi:ATP-dependent Clp protease ATP-binding subunit ClpC